MNDWPFTPQKQHFIPNLFFHQVKALSDHPAYWVQNEGVYHATNWHDYGVQVEAIAQSLHALKVEKGQRFGIIGTNSQYWTGSFIAGLSIGSVPVGFYNTSSLNDIAYIIDHGEIEIMFAQTQMQVERLRKIKNEAGCLKTIIIMPSDKQVDILKEVQDEDNIYSWDEFLKLGQNIDREDVHKRRESIQAEDLATLIYTSGTTGIPKGVMLSHRSIATAGWTLDQLLKSSKEDTYVSYLPLSHIVEQITSIYGPVQNGFQVYFARSIEKIAEDLKIVQPTLFFGPPRIWDKVREALQKKFAKATGVKKHILNFSMQTGLAYYQSLMEKKKPSPLLKLKYKIADKLLYSKVREGIGFARARHLFSGSAPINPDTLKFYTSVGMLVCEVYGLSENAGPSNFNMPDDFLISTVGKDVPGVLVDLAEDGEVLIGGAIIFSGYYKDEEATKAGLKNGWLHTGDLGERDKNGNLSITGRKKDVIITAGGKNISPRKIEEALEMSPLIEHCVVVGDNQRYLAALIDLNQEELNRLCETENTEKVDFALPLPQWLHKAIESEIKQVNSKLGTVEKIMDFAVLPEPLSIEAGFLTPTLKVKRHNVIKSNQALIETIYT